MTVTNQTHRRAFAVWFKNLGRWDVKSFTPKLESQYPIKQLASLIREHSERVELPKHPDQAFKILGVNNTAGVFHAYDALGKDINQPYQKVNAHDLVYNPYRVNVGSIGIVPEILAHNYISPAYVIFAVNNGQLDPTFLYLILKSAWYNPHLRAATAGSVRQNLTYDLLGTLKIPIPLLSVQRGIVAHWQQAQIKFEADREHIKRLEEDVSSLIYSLLGTEGPIKETSKEKLIVTEWKELGRWSFTFVEATRKGLRGFTQSKYPIVPLGQCLIETMNGYCIKPVAYPTEYRMLKLSALTPAGLDLTESKFIKVPKRIAERFSIHKNDLLICRSNAYEYVGKCALVEEDDPSILFPDIMIRVRVNSLLLPEYGREVIQTPLGRSFFQLNSRRAVGGMWKISSDDILNFPIPLPSLETQQTILAHIKEARANISKAREDANKKVQELEYELEALILGTKKF